MLKIFSNNKTTAKDEVILSVCVVIVLAVGVVLAVLQPSNLLTVFGVIIAYTGVMFIPSIVWRLHENYKENKG